MKVERIQAGWYKYTFEGATTHPHEKELAVFSVRRTGEYLDGNGWFWFSNCNEDCGSVFDTKREALESLKSYIKNRTYIGGHYGWVYKVNRVV